MSDNKKSAFPIEARGIEGVVQAIDALPNQFLHKLIGIDGLGASGKSRLAKQIQEAPHTPGLNRPPISIIHTEEFYKPEAERTEGIIGDNAVSPDFDWDRFENQVIKPVQKNLLVKYERWDWKADRWADWIEIPAENWLIIVGVYSLQSRFFPAYDYTIWMDVPKVERIKRMTQREGQAVAQVWQKKWLPREEHYLAIEQPENRATIILSE